ncbi:DMT family transporter [Nostoc sphaeroides]|uniref:EamA transporter family n=1 Tax=Nostoc sphaeroides CCNUC1 TaxID=2653204 RepID=A0A5P8WJI1_9NOSO|nr:DMT family transporter [Nostoc sphaeroides]QFS52731.1 EamA transporter family [Nostoc sphaeroides CCNUC1]
MNHFSKKSQNSSSKDHSVLKKQGIKFPKVLALMVLSAACFGLATVITKAALAYLTPLTLLVTQTASSVTFLWILIFWQGIKVPMQWGTLRASLAGLLEPGLSYIFGTLGISLTDASNATLIFTTEPIMTLVLAWLILRERITLRLVALGLLAFVGVVLITSSDIVSVSKGSLVGNLFVLFGVFCASLYAITTRRFVTSLEPLLLTALQQSVALLWFIFILKVTQFLKIQPIDIANIPWNGWLLAVVSGIMAYSLAFWLYLSALRHQPTSATSLYLTLIPLFGITSAYVFLGERLLPIQGLGGGLVIAAVAGISQLPQQTENNS